MTLWTTGDIARHLGVSGQRVHQLAARADFPAPVQRAGRVRLWDDKVVKRWAASWDRSNRGGRPKRS